MDKESSDMTKEPANMLKNKFVIFATALLTTLLAQYSPVVTAAEQEKVVIVKEHSDGSVNVDVYHYDTLSGFSFDPNGLNLELEKSLTFDNPDSRYAVNVRVKDIRRRVRPANISILKPSRGSWYDWYKNNSDPDDNSGSDHNAGSDDNSGSDNNTSPDDNFGSDTDASPDDTNDDALPPFVAQVMEFVNQERQRSGRSPLKPNDALIVTAQAHSEDMAKNGFLSHTGSDGSDPFQRMRDVGYNYRTAGENVAAGYPDASAVVKAWMNSSGHRANILNANFCEMGAGYALGQSGYRHYWTLDFGCR